jgi:hypothetical protein
VHGLSTRRQEANRMIDSDVGLERGCRARSGVSAEVRASHYHAGSRCAAESKNRAVVQFSANEL